MALRNDHKRYVDRYLPLARAYSGTSVRVEAYEPDVDLTQPGDLLL